MREIRLAKGAVALVDDQDFEFLTQWKWCVVRGYAQRGLMKNGRHTTRYMHREILSDAKYVDHADGNRLNNCRANLRPCSMSQNLANRATSRTKKSCSYKGVFPSKIKTRPWRASIKVNYREMYLGCFATPEAAARAYDAAAIEHFGEFAWLNFPDISPDGGPRQHALGISA